jgi:type I restriction enzyme S subunit
MSENKKLIPQLRFPEFEKAGEWEERRLGEVCLSIASGKDVNQNNGKYNLYGSTGIIGKTNNPSYHGNYILVARVGANAGFLNKVSSKFGATDNTLVISLVNSQIIDFIYYTLENLGLKKFIFGSGQPLITGGQLKNLELSFPSIEEQQKIADCLSSLDDLMAAESQKLSLLKEHKKGLMQRLFPQAGEKTPALRFPEFEKEGEWVERRLEDIVISESSNIALNKLELKPNGFPVYGADGIIGYIDTFQQNEKYISIVKDGAGVGRLNLCKSQSSILGTLTCLKSKNQEIYILDWIYYLLGTLDFSLYIKGSGIPHIYFSDFKNEMVAAPAPSEQQKIADCLSSLDDLIAAQAEKIELLKLHKKGLMQGLFPKWSDCDFYDSETL